MRRTSSPTRRGRLAMAIAKWLIGFSYSLVRRSAVRRDAGYRFCRLGKPTRAGAPMGVDEELPWPE